MKWVKLPQKTPEVSFNSLRLNVYGFVWEMPLPIA